VSKTETEIREGRHFDIARAKAHTVAELIDLYISDYLPLKSRSAPTQRGQLLWWRQELGELRLSDITAEVLAARRSKLLKRTVRGGKTLSPASANRYMAALSHVFTIAVTELGWIPYNPIREMKKLTESTERVRYLSDEERGRLLKVCQESRNRHLYPIVVLALSTAMRKEEIRQMRWEDVDLERGTIVLHQTKNRDRRSIPLAGIAHRLLKQLHDKRVEGSPFVFSAANASRPVDFRTAWETALRQADIQDFRFHDLRHSAASYLAMNGATLRELADILGHKSLEMVRRYAHLTEQHTASVVASMNEKVFGDDLP
jgi:integrase